MFRKILHIIIIISGLLGIAATVIVLPVSSSFSIGTVLPAIVGAVLLAYGLIHLIRPGYIIKNKIFRVIVIVCVVMGIALFVIVETLIIIGANSQSREKQCNFAIVLGAGLFPDGRLTLTLKNRLDTAYEYLQNHQDVICIVSGGKGSTEPVTEAEAMKNYLIELGISKDRIIMEKSSTNTKENMVFSAEIMSESYPDKQMTAAVITSDFHVYRALILAQNSGIEAFAISSKTPLRVMVNCYMREALAVINTLLFQMD